MLRRLRKRPHDVPRLIRAELGNSFPHKRVAGPMANQVAAKGAKAKGNKGKADKVKSVVPPDMRQQNSTKPPRDLVVPDEGEDTEGACDERS